MKALILIGLILCGSANAAIPMGDKATFITNQVDKSVRADIEFKIMEITKAGSGRAQLDEFIKWLTAQYRVGKDLADLVMYGEIVFIAYCNTDAELYSNAMAVVSKILVSHSSRLACMAAPEAILFAEGCFILGRVLGEMGGKFLGLQLYPLVKLTCR